MICYVLYLFNSKIRYLQDCPMFWFMLQRRVVTPVNCCFSEVKVEWQPGYTKLHLSYQHCFLFISLTLTKQFCESNHIWKAMSNGLVFSFSLEDLLVSHWNDISVRPKRPIPLLFLFLRFLCSFHYYYPNYKS